MKRIAAFFLLLYAGLFCLQKSNAAGWFPLVGSGGGGGCSPGTNATNYLARGSFNGTYTAAFCTLINGLDSDSLFAKFDALLILGNQNTTDAALNLISTSFTPTLNGSPTFTANKGYVGADASSTIYIDTGMDVGVNTTQCVSSSGSASCSLTLVVQDNLQASASGGVCAGTTTTGHQTRIVPWYSDGTQQWDTLSASQTTGFSTSASKGRFVSNRSGLATSQFYKNGSSIATSTTANDTTPNGTNMYVLAVENGSSAAVAGCGNYVGAYGIGSSLSAGDVTNLDGLLAAFGTAVGWP
jgi:hypothetical protein